MTFYIIQAFSAFLLSLLGTRLFILAQRERARLFLNPELKGLSRPATPRDGGLALVFAVIIGFMLGDVSYGIVMATFLLTAIAMLSGLIPVPGWVRLLVQVIAVAIPLSLMPAPLFGGAIPPLLDTIFTGALWIGFINLFNNMDGIDGISVTETVCIGIGLCFITAMANAFPSPLFSYGMVLASAGVGFLWWNKHPAKILLNIVGTMPLGFIIGYLLLLTAQAGYHYAAAILPAYYLSDFLITHGRRLVSKDKPVKGYYFRRAVANGRSQNAVTRYILAINILLIYLASRTVVEPDIAIYHLMSAYLTVFMLLGFFANTSRHAAP